MHLKSLTLRGFKSFASSTTVHLEPGMTCVVGPNGSGKSNVVDALAWVMGQQGAKSLRGGSMEDVIFAGTASRAPLGRAEVVLTIDNADGALPIDYREVTISRTMFRNGGSEYAINGRACRLLDVQELLSDSGIGRQLHVIVGQGQLDTVLHATPEDRRGFLEEAAGVLKHRKRKERALRKLESTQANLDRLQDLTGELRRQLTPLARQADAARRAAVVQAQLRDARLRLLADDVATLQAALARDEADEQAVLRRRVALEEHLAAVHTQISEAQAALDAAEPVTRALDEAWSALAATAARLDGSRRLAQERLRHLQAPLPAVAADPDATRREAERLEDEAHRLDVAIGEASAAVADAVQARETAEGAEADARRRADEVATRTAQRAAARARLVGRVEGLERRLATAESDMQRLAAECDDAASAASAAAAQYAALEASWPGLSQAEANLDARYERADAELADTAAALAAVEQQLHEAQGRRLAVQARLDALRTAVQPADGAAALLARLTPSTEPGSGADGAASGVLGPLADVLDVDEDARSAVAAVLGDMADAVAVAGWPAGAAALQLLHDTDGGRAAVVVAEGAGPAGAGSAEAGAGEARAARAGISGTAMTVGPAPSWPPLPAGLTYLADAVQAPAGLVDSVRDVLDRAVAVPDSDAAAALLQAVPSATAVTPQRGVLRQRMLIGGSPDAPSRLELQAAADDTRMHQQELDALVERLRFERAAADQAHTTAQAVAAAALAELEASDAGVVAAEEALARAAVEVRDTTMRAARAQTALADARSRRDGAAADLAVARAELAHLDEQPAAVAGQADDQGTAAASLIATLSQATREAREAETQCRLSLRTAEERRAAATARVAALRRRAEHERDQRRRAEQEALRRAAATRTVTAVLAGLDALAPLVASTREDLAAQRQHAERAHTEQRALLRTRQEDATRLAGELSTAVEASHRDEVHRAELRVRIDAALAKAAEDWGVGPTALLPEYGPDVPVDGAPFDRDEHLARAENAERALARLGRVNPLALEEYEAAQERLTFLTGQLDDVQRSRRDLLDVVREVDSRVQQAFVATYADVAREFELVFARLFPGGEGRLVLTDPDDLLATGVEVEARPAGKRLRRLSLLSGGERSLVAVAFLVALFRARPNPFYVLDEVEAALDDVNLGRLLELLTELRRTSQLVVITHQKRTMEAADALYGVAMRDDGVTTLVSQRLRQPSLVG